MNLSAPDLTIRARTWPWFSLSAAAGAVALGYLARGLQGVGGWAWALALLLTLICLAATWAGLEARTPLLVADRTGVRIRLGSSWRGLTWGSLSQIEVGRALVMEVPDLAGAIDGLDARGRRALRQLQRGETTLRLDLGALISPSSHHVADQLHLLAHERAPIVATPVARRSWWLPLAALRTGFARLIAAKPTPTAHPVASAPVQLAAAPTPLGPVAELVIDAVPGESVRMVTAPVLTDSGVRRGAAGDVGAAIAQARADLGLSLEQVAERTSVRPHLIEAIEHDDFSACGGDFYARGHVRALARTLHLDETDLLRSYASRFSTGPAPVVTSLRTEQIAHRRPRQQTAPPRVRLLLAATAALAVLWGSAALLTASDETVAPAPPLRGELAGDTKPITSPLTTPHRLVIWRPAAVATTQADGTQVAPAPVRVTVLDRQRHVVFSGKLGAGRKRVLVGFAPFTVRTTDAPSVHVRYDGTDLGPVSMTPGPGKRQVG